jgi:hypothetical protein
MIGVIEWPRTGERFELRAAIWNQDLMDSGRIHGVTQGTSRRPYNWRSRRAHCERPSNNRRLQLARRPLGLVLIGSGCHRARRAPYFWRLQ